MVRATSLLIAALLVLSGTAADAKKKPRKSWGTNRTAVQHDMGELLAPGAIAAIRAGMHGTAPAEETMQRMRGGTETAPREERAARGGERGPAGRTDRSTRPSAARVTWHVQPQGGAGASEHGGSGDHEGRAPVRVRAAKARH